MAVDLADLRQREDYPGEEVERTAAWGLVATNHPGERPALILQGHVDVVPSATRRRGPASPFSHGSAADGWSGGAPVT